MKNIILMVIFCAVSLSCKKETAAPAGSIMLVNNSTHPYDVFVNGKLEADNMPGGTSLNLSTKQTGYYSVRVLQVSGYVFYPTDLTYNGNVTDKGTLVVSFPD